MLGISLSWRSTGAFTYLKVKSAKCLCLLPAVLILAFYFGLGLGLENLVLFRSLRVSIRIRVADCCIQTAGESDKMRISHVLRTDRRSSPLRILSCLVPQPGRNVGRRMVVARSNRSRTTVELKGSRSCNNRLSRYNGGGNIGVGTGGRRGLGPLTCFV